MARHLVSASVIKSVRLDGSLPGKLKRFDSGTRKGVTDRAAAEADLATMHEALNALQEKLYAQSSRALLVVLQAMDTGGKDGLIRHVFGPLNPQGVRVTCFKRPSAEELAHGYLWRIHKEVPAKGMIRVFNRSHYEDVLIARVHELAPLADINKRYAHINDFERYLSDTGVVIVKLFLNIGYDEQRERLQARLANPDKHWKFDKADIDERKRWADYQDAYERMLEKCSTPYAPWYVIPSDRKWYRNWLVAGILLHTLESMELAFPAPQQGLAELAIPE
jgi:PPK2 family polyphosphate:nucleotide phosphotransferase